jgi:hypothetical protein
MNVTEKDRELLDLLGEDARARGEPCQKARFVENDRSVQT